MVLDRFRTYPINRSLIVIVLVATHLVGNKYLCLLGYVDGKGPELFGG